MRVAPPALDDHYDEVLRAFCGRPARPGARPRRRRRRRATSSRACSRERFELLDETAAGSPTSRRPSRRGTASGRSTTSCTSRSTATSSRRRCTRWLAGAAAAAPRPRAAAAADRLDGLRLGVERAFEAAGEELDVVVYVAAGRDRGKFLHVAPDGAATVVDEPNAYAGLALDERTVLLKIHGQVDRGATRERESFAVSEDDHIDYLVGGDAAGTVPVQLAARLRRSHLLFLGYAVDDWSLRVFLRRVWGGDRLAYRSWAVQPAAEHVATRALARARRRGVRRLARDATPRSSRG